MADKLNLQLSALQNLQGWIDACGISDEALIRRYVKQLLPSWKIVGTESGLWQRNGYRQNLIQIRNKENDRMNIFYWEHSDYWERYFEAVRNL